MLEALQWIEELGASNIIIESDSLMVVTVTALQQNEEYHPEVGSILECCRTKLSQRSDLVIHHVKKHTNRVPHLLARYLCLLDSFILFMYPPPLVLETLLSDVSG